MENPDRVILNVVIIIGREKMNINEAADVKLSGIDPSGVEREYSLRDFSGKPFILYFYPKDNTSGCTQEACDFRDNMNRLGAKAILVGVSPDSIKSHLKFQEKHSLNFILLSDPEHKLTELFGAWGEKTMCGKKYTGVIRSTFLIDANGEVVKSWRKVKVKGHVDEVLSALA